MKHDYARIIRVIMGRSCVSDIPCYVCSFGSNPIYKRGKSVCVKAELLGYMLHRLNITE